MTPSRIRRKPAAYVAVALAGAVLAAAVAALPRSASAQSTTTGTSGATGATGSNPNNYNCSGHIQPGKAEPGNPDAQIQYYLTCNGPITGYTLVIPPSKTQQITNFDASPLIELSTGPVSTDNFECDGSFPGNGFSCVGNYAGNFATPEIITAQFSLSEPACRKPAIDPQAFVTYATVSAGVVTQDISGPFDLGVPQHCAIIAPPPKAKAKAKA